MKSRLNIVFRMVTIFGLVLMLILPGSTASALFRNSESGTSPETAYHTIGIDGDLTDWSSDEVMESEGAYTLNFTWDASNLYLGLSGAYLGDGAQDKSFYVCFDTDLTSGSGAGSDGYGNVTFNRSFFAPEFCYYFAGAAGLYEWSSWSAGAWVWNGWRSDGSYYNTPANPAPNPGSELTIVRSDIGNPASLRMVAWLTPEQPISSPLEASWSTRNPTGSSPALTFYYHFTSLGTGIAPNAAVNYISINEARVDQPGTDNDEYFELQGPGGASLSNLYYLVIGDGTTGLSGVIEQVTNLSAYSIPVSGYFVAAEATFTLAPANLVTTLNFENDDNLTHLLVQGFTGANGQDLDTNDDGTLDVTPWTQVIDLIALMKSDNPPVGTEYHYGPPKIGPDGASNPWHVYWCATNWRIGAQALGADDTPGAANCLADLAIGKSAPPRVLAGSDLNYAVSMQNIGELDANSVTISDTLPASVTYLGDDSGYSCPACIPGATGTLTWTVGILASGASDTFTLTVLVGAAVPNGTVLTNTISTTTPDSERSTTNNSAQASTTVSTLDVSIDKLGPAYGAIGGQVTYNISVTTFGVTNADNVIVQDTLPISTTYVSDTSGITPTIPGPGVYQWYLGSQSPGSTFAFDLVISIDPNVAPGSTLTNQVAVSTTTPGDDVTNNTDIVNTTALSLTPIHDIQGSAHRSPLEGAYIEYTYGIVTALRSNGFYLQDPNPDADDATSEAMFVFTGSNPGRAVGDEVLVAGNVTEYRIGNTATNLSLTELTGVTVILVSTGNPLPAATVIGTGGRMPPDQVIEDDATGDVETSGVFDPATDGIDFYESLECMLVQVNDAIAVGQTNNFGEIAVVGDNGAYGGVINPRGGIVIQGDDYNPERILVDDTLISNEPQVNVGADFNTPIVGVMDYSFGNFKLYNTTALSVTNSSLISETTPLTRTVDQLTIATFNVLNLDPNPADGDDDTTRFIALANQIVYNLGAPDIVALQEIQDNSGTVDDGVVTATLTYQTLINAIISVGGPTYEYREISPVDGQDGGAPGGNIRVGFLFRTDRGLEFVDRPGGDPTTPVSVTLGANGVELSCSPGRIDPQNPWFSDSRKPLAGEFLFNGQTLIVIVNHLNSKSGDDPLFGRYQPPVLVSEITRINQAIIINEFVQSILVLDPQANVVVLGDMNDFWFSTPLVTLAGNELAMLALTLPIEERYTYLYDGNSQTLDHILVSAVLSDTAVYDIVHTNAEFIASLQASDHDPAIALLTIPPINLNLLKEVTPDANVGLGSVVTYTLTLNNPSLSAAYGIVLTDTLPSAVTFGGWVLSNGAIAAGNSITWTGSLAGDSGLTFIFTATLALDPVLYGQTITNTAYFVSSNDGNGSSTVSFIVEATPLLAIEKTVELSNDPARAGDLVTYTIVLQNSGMGDARNVHIVDVLPDGLIGNDVDIYIDIAAGGTFTLVITAAVAPGVQPGEVITNTVYFDHLSGSGGSAVSFTIQPIFIVHLPLVFRN